MVDLKISALSPATTPLAGSEVLPIVQGGTTVKVSVDNLTTGKTVTASNVNVTGLTASSAVATDTSKNLVSVTNTGSGNNVLATSPTLVTPALGTPSSGVATNLTGLPLATGVTGTLSASNGGTGVNNGASTLTLGVSTIITAAAATVLDDTTVSAMVDTLGGAASTGTGGLVRSISPSVTTSLQIGGTLPNIIGLSVSDTFTYDGDTLGNYAVSFFNDSSMSPTPGTTMAIACFRGIKFFTGGAVSTTIDGNGKVGIGTTSPSYALDVVGTINSSVALRSASIDTTAANLWSKAQRFSFTTLTDAATVAIDLSASNNFNLTLGGNRTLGVPTNPVAGQSGVITVRQDITGSRTLAYAWPYRFAGSSAPVLSTGKLVMDQLMYLVNSYSTGTATMTIATPCVVTWTAHGLTSGQRVQFTTTGALPTGVTANTNYWVTVVDANTFRLSTSLVNAQAATFVATSGSQSGTHTVTEFSITLTANFAIG